jgi:PAS domain S-box-containing protein
MLRKFSSAADNALFDAIAVFFSNTLPSSAAFANQKNVPLAGLARAKRESSERLAKTSRVVVAILGILTLITALLIAFEIRSLSVHFIDHRIMGWSAPGTRISFMVLLLLVIEFALIAAVSVQDKRRREVQALLLESEQRIAFAAEAAELGLWRWDSDTDSFWATEYCQEMFGIQRGAEYDMSAVTGAVHSEDREKVAAAIQRGRETGTSFEIEFRLALGSGGLRWVRARAKPTRDARGEIRQLAGTIVDISEKMTLRAEIEKQQQSLTHLTRVGVIGELSGALAHELNQPLTAILSNAQALKRMIEHEPLDVEELKAAIVDIIEDDARAGNVIRHLRTLLKKEEARIERIDINELVRKTLALARNDLTTRHIVPVLGLSAAPLIVTGDAIQLQQLLLNLVLNAADAMSESTQPGGVLMIASDLIGGEFVHVAISDTGPGIKNGVAEKLFEPFFSTKNQGLGLGLSISRSIVVGHGGTIWGENNMGRGAIFHVSIPRAKEAVS